MRAKRQADEFAAGFNGPRPSDEREAKPQPLTLKTLFDIYGEEVTPAKEERSRRYDRAAMKMFLGFLGRNRKPERLSQRDWDEEGRLLLESNPLKGLKAPKEKNPTRVLLTHAEYEALLKVSPRVDWRFRVALVIAPRNGTPYRRDPPASLVRHRRAGQDHPVARRE